ncbi:MAG: hypothetical protein R3B07_24850 [Polyangiaceae bacterium]
MRTRAQVVKQAAPSVLTTLSASLLSFGGCAAPSPPNAEAPPATGAESSLGASAAPESSAAAAAPPAQSAPPESPWRASFEEEMACRRAHCYTSGAAECLRTCYRYNHPRNPEGHERCNDNCRHNYQLDACDELCRVDKRAFAKVSAVSRAGQPPSVPACSRSANACNAGCETEPKNACLLGCIRELQRCEASTN